MKRYIHSFIKRTLTASLVLSLTLTHVTFAEDDVPFFSSNDILFYSTETQPCSLTNTTSASGSLPATIPEPWRTLINSAAPTYPKVDSRLVAATLWVENRGWPKYDTAWATSGAAAQGPWQFIPSTWASMGTDGDGDGRKDPGNPKDAVHAAFKHQLGSAGLPILTGATGDAQKDYDSVIFNRDRTNLMSFMAAYNGSGAPNGVPIAQMPNNENSNYLRMAYWLIASNFEKTLGDSGQGDFIDATTAGSLFGGNAPTAPHVSGTTTPVQGCPTAMGNGAVNSEGFSFPVLLQKNDVTNNQGKWPCTGVCHHDGTPAADLFKGSFPPGQDATEGTKVIAIEDGQIAALDNAYKGLAGCQSIIFKGKSGHGYWYGHMAKATVTTGQTVKAGETIAEVGASRCTGNNSPAHLHIDMSDTYNGIGIQRSEALIPLLNKLHEELPA